MFLTDRVSVSKPRRTVDGYLVADAKVARTGIQEYLGSEVGKPEMPIVRLYRPPDEVFSDATLRSFAHRPMTNDHPPVMVDASNWRQYAVGQTGDEVRHDDKFVRVPLVLMDKAAIADWEAGKVELSQGYTAEIVFEDGVTSEGEPYDAVQRNIRNNHLALVDRARGGEHLRIGDDNPLRKSTMPDIKTRTVLVDGLSVETTDAGAQAIDKLQRQLNDSDTAAARQTADHAAALALKDAEIAKRDAQIDTLQGQVMSDAALDARVQARSALLTKAKSLHDADYTGKSDMDIRKAVLVAKLGDAAVAGKSDAYIEARFDGLTDSVQPFDPVARALSDGAAHRTVVQDNGYAASVAGLDYRTKNQGA
ncbi:hypothetical protein Xmar_07780 [Xanthomonas axonopodis pv. martyniicola]|uniref:DUF2213 domain-containing protein n=1 Tax=Xanthomonas axonopodis TaxID=53413 RepID=UPI0009D1105D|nr:DUF2213 domain-containing protein [Xanthomonas axonopodis]OOW67171.1 hypothetical protein Xmar_07780 [Xanthomonas axonopodis pv. martyniicola]OOW90179.1 hypothetical protein Xvtr_19055 [Xanthomonas campestris pv. vitiscarnosae]